MSTVGFLGDAQIGDSSCRPGARYNDEKSWVEYQLTRVLPTVSMTKATNIRGITVGVHSESAYKQLEATADGVIDLKVEEQVWRYANAGENFSPNYFDR
jgi:hypothetical protein